MLEQWFLVPFSVLGMVLLSTLCVFIAVIAFTRLAGLRSFSKMSSFDFAMTIAVGSLMASTLISKDPPLLQGVVALAAIFGLQKAISIARRFSWFSRILDNEPMLLMRDGEVLTQNLERARVTLDDLRSKLREANILERSQVRAVVFETTGDISVLHSSDASVELEAWLLHDVQGAPSVDSDPLAKD